MDFRRSYSGNRRRTAPEAISFANSHASIGYPQMVEHGDAHLFCITCAKVAVRLVNNPGGFFFEYPRARCTLMHVRYRAMLS